MEWKYDDITDKWYLHKDILYVMIRQLIDSFIFRLEIWIFFSELEFFSYMRAQRLSCNNLFENHDIATNLPFLSK